MEPQASNYRREFLKSPHHVGLGLLTVGLGFISGAALPLIVGGTLSSLGWLYLPDFAFFRHWVENRNQAARQAEESKKVADFVQRRDALIGSLSTRCREKYRNLSGVCHDIESASSENSLVPSNPGN